MVQSGMPIQRIRAAMGSQLWNANSDFDEWIAKNFCEFDGCTTQPSFNVSGAKSAVRCALHKEDGMVNVVDKFFEFDECTTQPSFNVSGAKSGIRCALHKEDGMVVFRFRFRV